MGNDASTPDSIFQPGDEFQPEQIAHLAIEQLVRDREQKLRKAAGMIQQLLDANLSLKERCDDLVERLARAIHDIDQERAESTQKLEEARVRIMELVSAVQGQPTTLPADPAPEFKQEYDGAQILDPTEPVGIDSGWVEPDAD